MKHHMYKKELSLKTESRLEYKFILSNRNSFLQTIKDIGFEEVYSKRKINSLYLDTLNFSIFNHNQINDVSKKTIRIRQYNSDTNICKLEEKLNLNSGKFKNTKTFEGNFNNFVNAIRPIYKNFYPTSVVSYDRMYFLKEEFRITIDFNIVYTTTKYRKILKSNYNTKYSLAEIKLNKGHIDEFKMNQLIPIKHSKYEKSIEKLYKNK